MTLSTGAEAGVAKSASVTQQNRSPESKVFKIVPSAHRLQRGGEFTNRNVTNRFLDIL
jgi:hypothetical protein